MISLASEWTDRKERRARGWLFFDAECKFCTRIATRLANPMRRSGLGIAPLQDPRVGALLNLSREELLRTIRYVGGDGQQCTGIDALLAVARELSWARPLIWISQLPGTTWLLHSSFRWIAHRGRCGEGFHRTDRRMERQERSWL
jgi:predicted DCC family thiol-disulfide oxidoreductase YuxK